MTGKNTSGSPFTQLGYSLKKTLEIASLKQNISIALDLFQQVNQNSDSFILTTIVGALVLFFAGIDDQ
jgi:hypothetical protein